MSAEGVNTMALPNDPVWWPFIELIGVFGIGESRRMDGER